MTRNKYNARKCTRDGYTFDSHAERDRYCELRLLERAGEIESLTVHPVYTLQDAFMDGSGKKHRAIEFVPDFQYIDDGQTIVEDVKGGSATITPLFRVKVKMLLYQHHSIEFKIERR